MLEARPAAAGGQQRLRPLQLRSSGERRVNIFAAALLMPRAAVEHFRDVRLSFPEPLKKFDVSGRTIRIRLVKMGLL